MGPQKHKSLGPSKIPLIVDSIQFKLVAYQVQTGDLGFNENEISEFIGKPVTFTMLPSSDGKGMPALEVEGWDIHIFIKNWVLKDADGQFSVCTDGVFKGMAPGSPWLPAAGL